MLKSIGFILHIIIFSALLLWSSTKPGTLTIDWLDQTRSIHIGIALCAIYTLALLCLHLGQIWQSVISLPKSWQHNKAIKDMGRAQNALMQGLSALAANDAKAADYACNRALYFDPSIKDSALYLLVKAQSAKLSGQQAEATRLFTRLTRDKNAAFLGMRAQLQGAIDQQNYDQASALLQDHAKDQPNNPWLQRAAYQVAIKNQNWDEALTRLQHIEPSCTHDRPAPQDRTALHIAKAHDLKQSEQHKQALKQLEKAYKIDPTFAPLIKLLCSDYAQQNKRARAVKIIEKAWSANPHPELAALWMDLKPKSKNSKYNAPSSWALKLTQTEKKRAKPSYEGLLMRASAAMQDQLWGESRSYLDQAQRHHIPTKRYYEALAQLERAEKDDENAAQTWLDQAQSAAQDETWLCEQTGQTYTQWSAITPQGHFNTLRWSHPHNAHAIATLPDIHKSDIAGLI